MNGRGDGVGTEGREYRTAARPMTMTIHPLRIRPAGKWTPRPRRLYHRRPVQLVGVQVHALAMLTALASPPDSRIRDRYDAARLAQAVQVWYSVVG